MHQAAGDRAPAGRLAAAAACLAGVGQADGVFEAGEVAVEFVAVGFDEGGDGAEFFAELVGAGLVFVPQVCRFAADRVDGVFLPGLPPADCVEAGHAHGEHGAFVAEAFVAGFGFVAGDEAFDVGEFAAAFG